MSFFLKIYHEYEWRMTNERYRCGQFAFVSSAVGNRLFISVLLQT